MKRSKLSAIITMLMLNLVFQAQASPPIISSQIPVIYDSDIGDDIDDTWALGFLLRCPELDVKLVIGDQGRTEYRTKLFAKFLERAGRTDIPIGVGLDLNKKDAGAQADWVADYKLADYPGTIHQDGIQVLIDTIMKSKKPITLIGVGPVPNIAEALKREPRIANKARFVGMHGSVRLGYGGNPKISNEYNVRADVPACRKVFAASWDVTITPLDTCGLVHLKGAKYQKIKNSQDPICQAIMENYQVWIPKASWIHDRTMIHTQSSTLFDPVAVYLAFSQECLILEDLTLNIDDKGYTHIIPAGKPLHVATKWTDLPGFEDLLVKRLTELP